MAGRTSHTWFEIPKGTQVGVALGDLQASVYSCMGQRTDAGKFAFCFLLRLVLLSPQYQLSLRVASGSTSCEGGNTFLLAGESLPGKVTGLRVLSLCIDPTRAGEGKGCLFLSMYSMTKRTEISLDHDSVVEYLPSVHEALDSVLRMRGEARGGD